jgi:hypothetical protein
LVAYWRYITDSWALDQRTNAHLVSRLLREMSNQVSDDLPRAVSVGVTPKLDTEKVAQQKVS